MQINIKYDDRHYEHIGHEEQQKDEKVDMNDLFSAKTLGEASQKIFAPKNKGPLLRYQKHGLKPRMGLTPSVKMFPFFNPSFCLFICLK